MLCTISSCSIQLLFPKLERNPLSNNPASLHSANILLPSSPENNHTALNPPSRLSTQLFAYLLVAKKTAASAISVTSPKRDKGMEFNASERAGSDIALKEVVSLVSLIFLIFLIAILSLRMRNGTCKMILCILGLERQEREDKILFGIWG